MTNTTALFQAKDWTGNKRSTFATLGASNHAQSERQEHDFYATEPLAAEKLIEALETLNQPIADNVWESANGLSHLSDVFEKHGFAVRRTDLVVRDEKTEQLDFLDDFGNRDAWAGDIITNPPYKFALEFVQKALTLVNTGNKVCMFLRIQFLEGKQRQQFYKQHPPKYVLVFSERINCARNAEFETFPSSAMCYAWFVWEKGYSGHPIIHFI